jgi:hypothetical protein
MVGRALLGSVLACVALRGSAAPARHAADAVRLQLAAAFERKDLKAIAPLVSDAWSGLRFCASWDARMWKAAAVALRGARLRTSGERERVYEVALAEGAEPSPVRRREIQFLLSDGSWRLDLNSFLGPFPHE